VAVWLQKVAKTSLRPKNLRRQYLEPGIERVQALADTSRSALLSYSNETRAPIANPPIFAQLDGTS